MVKNGVTSVLRGFLVLGIVATLGLSAWPQQIQVQAQQNLLRNSGFEDGWYDVSGTQQCPNHWEMHWTEGEQMGDAQNITVRPESRVVPKAQIPPHEQDLFFWDGNYTLKMFWAKHPIHVAISQDVTGLEVGRQYRFVVPTYVDTYIWDSEKIPPTDPYAAQVRLGAGPQGVNWRDEGAISFSGWANAANTSPFYLDRITLQFTFVATAPDMRVFVEYASKWGLDNNGIFMDALRLEPLGTTQPPSPTPPPDAPTATPEPTATPGPSPTPLPTATPRPDGATVHIVESGDTLYAIALRYGVSPEQIRELNAGSIGPDDLIQVGQELIISVPEGAPTSTPLPESPTPTPETETDPVAEATPTPADDPEAASVCVLAFHDRGRDTVRDPEADELLPNVNLILADASGVVDEYTTDGVSEPYCFTGLSPGSYRVIQQPPEGYEATGPSEQNVALAEGTSLDIEYGSARTGEPLSPEGPDEEEETESTLPEDETSSGPTEALLSGNVLVTVARVAGVLVLLLAGAIAVLFVLTRRRRY